MWTLSMLSVVCYCLLLTTDTKTDRCYDEIGRCAQSRDTIRLGSLIDTVGRTCVITQRKNIFSKHGPPITFASQLRS